MKKLVVSLGILSFLFLGGIYMLFGFGDSEWEQVTQQTVQKKENKLTLTKEQQDNVVRWIVRGYEVQEVKFLQLSQNKSTGIYLLSFRINGDPTLETTIPADNLNEFDASEGELLLGPVNVFQTIMRIDRFNKIDNVDISSINITYLED